MNLVLPIVLAGVILLAAAGLAIVEIAARLRSGSSMRPRRTVDRSVQSWAIEVRRRLPAALDSQQVAAAGYLRDGKRPRPTFAGPGRPTPSGFGWEWELNLPGKSAAVDWDAARIVAAVNTGDKLTAVAELHQGAPGWAKLAVFKRDPLATTQRVPWRPGDRPACCAPGVFCCGVQRNGSHVHYDLVRKRAGTVGLLGVGRRGSGKSEMLRLLTAQMLAWGWTDPIIVDLVRAGVDYAVFEPALSTPIITHPDAATAAIKVHADIAAERAREMKARGERILDRFDRKRPLLPMIIDEVQALPKDAQIGLRRNAQQTRPQGLLQVLATQYGTDDNIDRTLKLQLGHSWVGRTGDPSETYVACGTNTFPGRAPHELTEGNGAALCESDGRPWCEAKTWLASDQWLADHVGLLVGHLDS